MALRISQKPSQGVRKRLSDEDLLSEELQGSERVIYRSIARSVWSRDLRPKLDNRLSHHTKMYALYKAGIPLHDASR